MVRRSTTSACVHCYVLLSVPCVLFPLLCFVAVPLGYIVRCPSLNVLDLLAILVPVLRTVFCLSVSLPVSFAEWSPPVSLFTFVF